MENFINLKIYDVFHICKKKIVIFNTTPGFMHQ